MTTTDHAKDEKQIRQSIDSWAKALHDKNVDGVAAHYAPDVVAFDLLPPLQFVGIDASKKVWRDWFQTFDGPVGFDVRDVHLTVGDDVAFARSFNHISGARTDGSTTDVWVRATVGFQKIRDRWLITHEHSSVPFYMDGSFKAAVDLKP